MKIIKWILEAFFSCHHERWTFPQTDKRSKITHVTCLDCGKEFPYDWERMERIG